MTDELHLTEHKLLIQGKRLLCLIDGEHYPPVTRAALDTIKNAGGVIVGLLFLGGTEKIENPLETLTNDMERYSVYVGDDESLDATLKLLKKAVDETQPDLAVDLSDEPIVSYVDRFRLASHSLHLGVAYLNADTAFWPPEEHQILQKPSLAIIGTGKRVGKTAVSVTISRLFKKYDITPVVVAMGRGGPPEPEVIMPETLSLSIDYLLEHLKQGKHVASDYWEDALLAQVPTIGCRRCGGGMAGNAFNSNVLDGARKANNLPVDLVIMEGSGQTLPPVKTDHTILIANVNQRRSYITGYFGEYRILRSDLILFTNCEKIMSQPQEQQNIVEQIRKINPDIEIAFTIFRPEPLSSIEGKKVFLASTAPDSAMGLMKQYLESEFQCEIIGHSRHLSNRSLLRKDFNSQEKTAEILLTELKAAAIDVAGKIAVERQMEVVLLHNRAELVGGTVTKLDDTILSMCGKSGEIQEV